MIFRICSCNIIKSELSLNKKKVQRIDFIIAIRREIKVKELIRKIGSTRDNVSETGQCISARLLVISVLGTLRIIQQNPIFTRCWNMICNSLFRRSVKFQARIAIVVGGCHGDRWNNVWISRMKPIFRSESGVNERLKANNSYDLKNNFPVSWIWNLDLRLFSVYQATFLHLFLISTLPH